MDLLVLLSNCPQLNNPCNGYNPTPVEMIIWEKISEESAFDQGTTLAI